MKIRYTYLNLLMPILLFITPVVFAQLPLGTETVGSTGPTGSSGPSGVLSFPTNNTTKGINALSGNTTGSDNSAFSQDVIAANTTGFSNTASGTFALFKNTTGIRNTASGERALFNNITGNSNTASGTFALFSNTTGNSNTASGERALFKNTTGHNNTASGENALYNNTTGGRNTAGGRNALFSNTTGNSNTASGERSLFNNTTGNSNIASGERSLFNNTTGNSNIASGERSLFNNTTGNSNIASGERALFNNTTGHNNIAVGSLAGSNATTGDGNIYIGNMGVAAESNTIRIGTTATQTSTFIAGIRGVTTGLVDAVTILIDSNGQLGTVSSSRRYKEKIEDMGEVSSQLMQLRPVTFRYIKEYAGGERPVQPGLIAEEVVEIYPDLVVHDSEGEVETVQYHKLIPMLLNELQKQERELKDQQSQIAELTERLSVLEATRAPTVAQAN